MNENDDYLKAQAHSSNHYDEIISSDYCGCFYCLHIFAPDEITEWVEENTGDKTALCPYCEMDAVIGSKSGYKITKEFLSRMQKHWF